MSCMRRRDGAASQDEGGRGPGAGWHGFTRAGFWEAGAVRLDCAVVRGTW